MKFKALFVSLAMLSPIASHATDLETLADWMTGSFNSKAQSVTNEKFYNINLEMTQIWPGSESVIWLYVEQAVATDIDKPYRQRVYKLEKVAAGQFLSTVYAMPDPDKVVGAWQKTEKLAGLTPEALLLREGCHINISLDDKGVAFVGSTDQKLCSSKLRGATYATSHVDIQSDVLTSWDQGFDSDDKQVWGAIEGPYVFDKVKNYTIR
ncbi:chromophore lyase CpcT/CpeT [Thalassotalea euphylliae]|uniref:chromophore lyase CpcT/CpeT n=1 Tax=Thalassotalea euphylliae TaxID=1655234 RepID=UPI00362D1559